MTRRRRSVVHPSDIGHPRHREIQTPAAGEAVYDRDGADLSARGLYLDMPAWGYHAFVFSGS